MKILYICQRVPFPPDRGDRIVAFHQIKHLRTHHEVIVGSLNDRSPRCENHLSDDLGVNLIAPYHCWRHRLRGMAASFLMGRPLSLGYFGNGALRSSIDNLIRINHFDAIMVFTSSMAQYVEHANHIPRIMHFCDLDSQKWMDLASRRTGWKRWIYLREGRLLLKYEKKLAREFTASCVVTQQESELFQKCIPGASAHVLENGVDIEYFAGLPRQPSDLNLVFVGVMDYPPNEEAVSYFAERIWPTILAAHPKARFTIVGSRPTRKIRRLVDTPGIEVTGHVPDIRPYLSSATLMIAPLQIARGVQNKVLEAMAAGVPILTTPVVARGLPSGADSTIFVAEREPTAFSSVLLSLIASHQVREEKAAAARKHVRKYCSWQSRLESLDRLLEEVVTA